MPGTKTNERPGTRAVLRHSGIPAPKARQVLDLIRGEDVDRAAEILAATPRQAAIAVAKVLSSAVANAVHNDGQDAEDLYVSACYADEATTLKRWRARARGRAGRIYKRSSHVTVIVSRMDDERLARRRAERDAHQSRRSRRVAESRRSRADLSGRLTRRRAAQAEAEEARLAAEEAEAEALEEVEAADFEEALANEAEAEDLGDVDEDVDDGADGAGEESES
jgi:large subunit ribosomal protein L22